MPSSARLRERLKCLVSMPCSLMHNTALNLDMIMSTCRGGISRCKLVLQVNTVTNILTFRAKRAELASNPNYIQEFYKMGQNAHAYSEQDHDPKYARRCNSLLNMVNWSQYGMVCQFTKSQFTNFHAPINPKSFTGKCKTVDQQIISRIGKGLFDFY